MLLATGTLPAVEPAPLSPDLQIFPPDRNAVPEKLAEFSGIREGRWTFLQNRMKFATFTDDRIGKERALVPESRGPIESGSRGGITKDPGRKRVPGRPVEKAADGNQIITGMGMMVDRTGPFSRKK